MNRMAIKQILSITKWKNQVDHCPVLKNRATTAWLPQLRCKRTVIARRLQPRATIINIWFVVPLILFLSGCAGLANEPAIIRTASVPTVTPTAAPDLGKPLRPVSLAAGAQLYNGAQGCVQCHGTSGKGDGPVAASLTCKVPNVADPATARDATLAAWFLITTNGNGQTQGCLMPPWKGRLNEQQRWDVTAYMHALGYSTDQYKQGETLYAANCASCHGAKGAGDGPRAKELPRPVTNLSDTSYMITHTDRDLFTAVTNGVGAIMPAFPNLSEAERWAVVSYSRSLSWLENIDRGAAAKPVETTDDAGLVRIPEVRMLIDFANGKATVQQGYTFVNSSQQRAILDKAGNALSVTLPQGATNAALDVDMQRQYKIVVGPDVRVVSTQPLAPGESRPLTVSYELPAAVPLRFEQINFYNVERVSVFLLAESGLAVADPTWQTDSLPLQDQSGRAITYRQFTRIAPILSGLPLRFTLDSESKLITEDNTNRRNTLAIVIALSLVAFGAVGFGVWRISRAG